jgi:predicted nucleotidyltransferase
MSPAEVWKRGEEVGLADKQPPADKDTWIALLTGVVGSHAYGLNGPESDVDRMTVALAPSEDFFGFHPPVNRSGTRVQHEPEDHVTHELGKFCSLALKCNPSILELLWLPEHEWVHPVGQQLIDIRGAFLSRRLVKDAYLGYARAQFQRLQRREDGTFSSDTRNRTLKHARHLIRLAEQGMSLYLTSTMTVRVHDRERLFRLSEEFVADPRKAEVYLNDIVQFYDDDKTSLPEEPDAGPIEEWLKAVRMSAVLGPPRPVYLFT